MNLASGLNGEVVAELSALKSALRQQAQTRGTDYLERVVGETTETGSYSRLTSAAGFVTDMVSNVASLASEASKSITQLMDKGMCKCIFSKLPLFDFANIFLSVISLHYFPKM